MPRLRHRRSPSHAQPETLILCPLPPCISLCARRLLVQVLPHKEEPINLRAKTEEEESSWLLSLQYVIENAPAPQGGH